MARFPYVLSFTSSKYLAPFLAELQSINFMLTPDPFQPVKFKIKNDNGSNFRIFTGGVHVDNEAQVVFESLVENRISLTMKGGVYDGAAPTVFFRLEPR